MKNPLYSMFTHASVRKYATSFFRMNLIAFTFVVWTFWTLTTENNSVYSGRDFAAACVYCTKCLRMRKFTLNLDFECFGFWHGIFHTVYGLILPDFGKHTHTQLQELERRQTDEENKPSRTLQLNLPTMLTNRSNTICITANANNYIITFFWSFF